MKILGIETVTKNGSLAVVENGKVILQTTIDTELKHAANLVLELDKLLRRIKIDISKIDTIAVDVGPGSFTGIRVGIASAKGLAQPDNKNLVGICSLEVLCYEAINKHTSKDKVKYLVPFIDAKRGGIYTGLYEINCNNIKIVKNVCLSTLDKLLDAQNVPSNSYIFGPDIKMLRKDDIPVFPRATTVALLAENRINCGLKEKKLEPMYIYDVKYNRA